MKVQGLLFATGGIGYGMMELLFRRRTHWSMVCAGGLSFCWFARVARIGSAWTRLQQALACAAGVTVIEFLFGVLFNLILKKNVWDYSRNRFHILGQVCPLFSALWGVLGLLFMPLADRLRKQWGA